jgi:hypothetical protein
MNSVLALSDRERAELFSATARKLGFSNEAIAEKDFWVCWTLGQLFQGIPGIGDHLVFKGGTSLSKVYRAINRFSEDVDITVGRELLGFDSDEHAPEKAANKSQAKKKTEQLVAACGRWVAGDFKTQLESRTRDAIGSGPWKYSVDDTDELTLLFRYPSALPTPIGGSYISRVVRIECGAKADLWPVTTAIITPYVAEAYPRITDTSVPVRALAIERTFWEKATILHAEAHRPKEKLFTKNYSRHYADMAALADHEGGKRALADSGLRTHVVAFKEAFYRNSWTNFATAIPGTFNLLPAPDHLGALEGDYQRMRREMYYGPSLEWAEILRRLGTLKDEINSSG